MVLRPKTNIHAPIERLRGVGSRNILRLLKLGITTVKHLLWHLPARYEDYSRVMPISEISVGERVHIQGEIVRITARRLFPRRMVIVDAIVQDPSGAVRAVWFNQPYVADNLIEGSQVSLAGKVSSGKRGLYLSSPVFEKIASDEAGSAVSELRHTEGLVPVYPETEGVTSKYLRFLIKPLLADLHLDDPVPPAIVAKYSFPDLTQAIRDIHYPDATDRVQTAKDRLAFDDLLLFQLKALLERRKMNQMKSAAISFDQKYMQEFIANLPFELTQDQKIAAWEILKDIQKPYPMNRLLEGDVGSGKTVVALIAAVQAAQRGYQTVFMAPTEVLAIQHFATLRKLTAHTGLNAALLTGSAGFIGDLSIPKPALKNKIACGEAMIIIGTHAVIQKDVRFKNLALVVIDEQHHFGINQRAALLRGQEAHLPHLLSMTATPIPRTLALTIFGDLDISLIKEKPANRRKIITKIISAGDRNKTYKFIRDQIKEGRQVFVICPRIDTQSVSKNSKSLPERQVRHSKLSQSRLIWQEVKAVEEEYERLSRQIFPDLKVGMLHGKLKSKEKQSIMQAFTDGWYNVLVSTSVVEVGVDVPNASIMMIESADRFGLAQLHQFRGRVGRAEHQSYCFLFSSGDPSTGSTSSPQAGSGQVQRLRALVQCDDGFELAEKDMTIRGPGEFFGIKQSGMPDLTMAALANVDLIKKARLEARLLLKEDPSLTRYPLLRDWLEEFQKMHHFE